MSIIFRIALWLRQILEHVWIYILKVSFVRTIPAHIDFLPIKAKKPYGLLNKTGDSVLIPYKDIPAAKHLPVFGTLFNLMAAGGAHKLHKYVDARHKQLGPLFRERLYGTNDVVFIASASLMRSVFLYEGKYPKHPLPEAWVLYNTENCCKRGLFFMNGEEWLHNRRILNKHILNGDLAWIDEPIHKCTARLIQFWHSNMQNNSQNEYTQIKNLEQQLYHWAIEVICSIMFGSLPTTTTELETALTDFSSIVHKIFQNSAALTTFPPKIARAFNLQIWKDFEQSVNNVLNKGEEIIDIYTALKSNLSKETNPQLKQCSKGLFDKLQEAKMPLEIIRRIFVDLIIAAGDTTAYTSEWALYSLSQNSALQHRIAEESVASSEQKDTKIVSGFLKEILRLYPVAPFIGRYLDYDAVLGNYMVKKDTLVLLSLYTAGRNPNHFPDPLIVNPDRWTRDQYTDELMNVLQSHGTMPFAIGKRACIGRKIAIKQIIILLSAISQNFELKCYNERPLKPVLRLVTVPDQKLDLAIKRRY